MPEGSPRIIIFAGPNGAGKTTHAEPILARLGVRTFVNADYIARGLSGRQSDAAAFEAGRIMLGRLRDLAREQVDFAFESTLSSRSFAPFLRTLKDGGYRVSIYFFSLRTAALAVRRVKHRVKLGGHDVPSDVVTRRFFRSLHNFIQLYQPLADEWNVFDNSTGKLASPIASGIGSSVHIKDTARWSNLLQQSNQHPKRC
jgi:predicted ABC-type ATPase